MKKQLTNATKAGIEKGKPETLQYTWVIYLRWYLCSSGMLEIYEVVRTST